MLDHPRPRHRPMWAPALFGTGYALYGDRTPAVVCLGAAVGAAVGVMRVLPKIELR